MNDVTESWAKMEGGKESGRWTEREGGWDRQQYSLTTELRLFNITHSLIQFIYTAQPWAPCPQWHTEKKCWGPWIQNSVVTWLWPPSHPSPPLLPNHHTDTQDREAITTSARSTSLRSSMRGCHRALVWSQHLPVTCWQPCNQWSTCAHLCQHLLYAWVIMKKWCDVPPLSCYQYSDTI